MRAACSRCRFRSAFTKPNIAIEAEQLLTLIILPASAYDQWLDPNITQTAPLQALLVPYDSEKIEAIAVSCAVNNPKNDSAECISALV